MRYLHSTIKFAIRNSHFDLYYLYSSTSYYVYNKDVQGSTSCITAEDGSAAAIYEYSDFGEVTTLKGGVSNEIRYTGAIYDGKTGLYYMNARYYDPANGRFISQDTYRGGVDNTDQWHLYVYCANNPINYVDPSGHFSIKVSGTSIIAKVSFVVI